MVGDNAEERAECVCLDANVTERQEVLTYVRANATDKQEP